MTEHATADTPDETTSHAPITGRIVVVGCGFVGSIFTYEYLKRAFAGKLLPELVFIDDDTVEDRNSANQNFRLSDTGLPKAQVMRVLAEENGKSAQAVHTRLTAENMEQLLEGASLIVDGVDNLITRQLLWGYALRTGVPCVHIGISLDGTGKVEWTAKTHDTFSLSPKHTFGKTIVEPQSGVTPPCELARMRGVGLNAGFAAAMSVGIYLGFDPESHYKGEDTHGLLTEWHCTPMSHFPLTETWGRDG